MRSRMRGKANCKNTPLAGRQAGLGPARRRAHHWLASVVSQWSVPGAGKEALGRDSIRLRVDVDGVNGCQRSSVYRCM